MTKKHYERIAFIIHTARTSVPKHNHEWWIAENLADYFATDNKNFDRTRFLQACGIESWLDKYPKPEQQRYIETVKKDMSQT